MSANEFKKQLAACRDQRAVESLLQGSWSFVKGTLDEFAELREAVISKVEELTSLGVCE